MLDGISGTLAVSSDDNGAAVQTVGNAGANEATPEEIHHIDTSFALEQIRSPLIVIILDTYERIYFIDCKALSQQAFQEQYGIGEIRAVRDEMKIRLIRK